MRHLQTVHGARYTYDETIGAIFFGDANAEDFVYDQAKMTYSLAACGCAAETGCRCRQSPPPLTGAAASGGHQTVYRTMAPPPPLPTTGTSPEMVRHMVAQKKAEMRAAEIALTYRGTPGQRRLANEAARAFKHAVATTPPNPYDAPAAERRRLDEMREARR